MGPLSGFLSFCLFFVFCFFKHQTRNGHENKHETLTTRGKVLGRTQPHHGTVTNTNTGNTGNTMLSVWNTNTGNTNTGNDAGEHEHGERRRRTRTRGTTQENTNTDTNKEGRRGGQRENQGLQQTIEII